MSQKNPTDQRPTERKRLTPRERSEQLRNNNLRKPIGGNNFKLGMPDMKEEGWQLRWFNGNAQNLINAKQAGYEPVFMDDVIGDVVSDSTDQIVRSNETGIEATGSQAFLMKIPKEIWREDQRKHADATHERSMNQIARNKEDGKHSLDETTTAGTGKNEYLSKVSTVT